MNKNDLALWRVVDDNAPERLPSNIEYMILDGRATDTYISISTKLEDFTRLDDLILEYLFLVVSPKDDYTNKLCEELIIARMQVLGLQGAELREHLEESLLSTGIVYREKRMKVTARYKVKVISFEVSDTTRARIEKGCC